MLLSARQCYLYADDQPIVRTTVAKNTQVKVVATRCAIVISDPIYLAHFFIRGYLQLVEHGKYRVLTLILFTLYLQL